MNNSQILILTILTMVVFTPYIVFETPIIGNDSYYFLEKIQQNELPPDEFVLGQAIFSILPHHPCTIKVTLFFLTLISVLIVAKTGEIFFPKNGWLAGLFLFLSPALFFEMAQLETEQFAISILFAANYLILKGVKEKNTKLEAIGLLPIFISGLIWKGSIFYLLPLSLLSIIAAPFTLIAILMFLNQLEHHLTPGLTYENQFMVGYIYLGPFIVLVLGLFLNPYIAGPGLVWMAIVALNAKFTVHLIPWLALGALHLYNNKALNNLDKKFGKPIWKNVQTVLFISCLIMPLVWGYSIAFAQPPTTGQTQIVQEFVSLQEQGLPAENEWSYGYIVKYFGGEPTAYGGPGDWDKDFNGSYALVSRPLDCNLLNQERYMRLYKCGFAH
jgi:hypothetical protein